MVVVTGMNLAITAGLAIVAAAVLVMVMKETLAGHQEVAVVQAALATEAIRAAVPEDPVARDSRDHLHQHVPVVVAAQAVAARKVQAAVLPVAQELKVKAVVLKANKE